MKWRYNEKPTCVCACAGSGVCSRTFLTKITLTQTVSASRPDQWKMALPLCRSVLHIPHTHASSTQLDCGGKSASSDIIIPRPHDREEWKCSPRQRVTSKHPSTVEVHNHRSKWSWVQQLRKPTKNTNEQRTSLSIEKVSSFVLWFPKSPASWWKHGVNHHHSRCSGEPSRGHMYLFIMLSFHYLSIQDPKRHHQTNTLSWGEPFPDMFI